MSKLDFVEGNRSELPEVIGQMPMISCANPGQSSTDLSRTSKPATYRECSAGSTNFS
jgi:hypothetical protein